MGKICNFGDFNGNIPSIHCIHWKGTIKEKVMALKWNANFLWEVRFKTSYFHLAKCKFVYKTVLREWYNYTLAMAKMIKYFLWLVDYKWVGNNKIIYINNTDKGNFFSVDTDIKI